MQYFHWMNGKPVTYTVDLPAFQPHYQHLPFINIAAHFDFCPLNIKLS